MFSSKNWKYSSFSDRIWIFASAELSPRMLPLPVSARNQLDNGISQNLWYEEVVPHETVFYLAVLSNGTMPGDQALESFDKVIKADKLFQFGGNATIGYGLTMLEEF